LHVKPHIPIAHVAVAPAGGMHATPHDPQFVTSVAVSLQAPDGQRVCPDGQPPAHAYAFVVMSRLQTGVVPEHVT
jgi:hypothetical protein